MHVNSTDRARTMFRGSEINDFLDNNLYSNILHHTKQFLNENYDEHILTYVVKVLFCASSIVKQHGSQGTVK